MYFQNKNIYIIGISGIGTSGLAMFLNEKNIKLEGSSDIRNKQVEKLENKNIKVNIGHNRKIQENVNIIIYTEAINKETNQEFIDAKKRNIECLTYRQALGKLTKEYELISISGTHGKTTTTSLLIAAFLENKIDINAIVGTNIKILNDSNYKTGTSKYFILETCELNEGFLSLNPDILGITNIELDHLESFNNEEEYISCFQSFCKQVKDQIFINAKDKNSKELKIPENKTKLFNEGKLPDPKNLIGEFNKENADLALKIANYLGLAEEKSLKGIQEFEGIDKRMMNVKDNIYIDYAHHPTAIKKALEGFKDKFKNSKICLIYQPHQYSRTIKLIDQFKDVFNKADKVIITDIYECRDNKEDVKNMNVEKFISKTNHHNILNGEGLENTKKILDDLRKEFDYLIIMGAGNISNLYVDLY
ncbi:hypothetical protein HOJ01_03635 [bacterium]|jgi:UDP-N-acetylmuramate--alanine ligase|nr:hypothetical protein [bacterium]MBT6293872.1 hypothetical protein [bacterium]